MSERAKTKKTCVGRPSFQPPSTLQNKHQWRSLGHGIQDVMSSTMERILREAYSERLQRRMQVHFLPA